MSRGPLRHGNDSGQTLILLLVVALLLLPLGVGFLSSMFLQQRLAGDRYRSAGALFLAEAGIEKALWYLERDAPDGSRDASWRPRQHSEELGGGGRPGRFTVEVHDEAEGRAAILSTGEIGGVRRGVKVIAKIAPGALDYALFGSGTIAIEGDQAILSLVEVRDRCLAGVMLGSNAEIWFRTPGSRVEFVPCGANESVLRIALPEPHKLTVGDAHGTSRFMGLQQFGVQIGRVDVRTTPVEAVPAVDVRALRRRAERNQANSGLNRAAGEAAGRPELRDKPHSLYSSEEFALVMRYLRGRSGVLVGAVFVSGNALIPADVPLLISEGFLAVAGGLTVEAAGRVTVRHSRNAKLLPGIVTIGRGGTLTVGEEAWVEVEGAVASEGAIDLREGSVANVQGAILAMAPQFSLRLNNATLRIRYDPQVLGTVGLLATGDHQRVFPVSWQELR